MIGATNGVASDALRAGRGGPPAPATKRVFLTADMASRTGEGIAEGAACQYRWRPAPSGPPDPVETAVAIGFKNCLPRVYRALAYAHGFQGLRNAAPPCEFRTISCHQPDHPPLAMLSHLQGLCWLGRRQLPRSPFDQKRHKNRD
jgi:hypothetical protein